jgi:hypothetical protein
VALLLFQIVNAATANYGFFCYLAAALNLFLLDDADVERVRARLARALPAAVRGWSVRRRNAAGNPAPTATETPPTATETPPTAAETPPTAAETPPTAAARADRRWLGRAAAALFVAVSLIDGLYNFTEPGRLLTLAGPLFELNGRFRLINSYHLFASVTRERIEPELQTLAAGQPVDQADDDRPGAWTAQDLWHKPGDPRRAPDFVAPHQPRVDFQLWFYGLAFRRREPAYVGALVRRMCEDPAAVQPLFRSALPTHPAAVRLVYWQYHFASRAEHRATGAWWTRQPLAASRAIPCAGPAS